MRNLRCRNDPYEMIYKCTDHLAHYKVFKSSQNNLARCDLKKMFVAQFHLNMICLLTLTWRLSFLQTTKKSWP